MSDIINVLKNFKLDKKTIILIICGVLAVIFLLIGELTADNEKDHVSVTDTSAYSAQYIKKAESDLKKIISKINGAGKTDVLITLESCYENVYAKAYEQNIDSSENNDSTGYKEQYAIVKKGSQNEECLILKVYEPKVKGIAVVCEGGDKTAVIKAVTETVCALYDISSDKVSVAKMN